MATDSIQRRLRRGIVGTLLVSSLLTFGGLFLLGRHHRVQAFEQALLDDFRTIANITQVYPGDDVYVNVEPEALGQYLAGGNRYFQVWDSRSGALLDQSGTLEQLRFLFPRPAVEGRELRRLEERLPDGRPISLLTQVTMANWGLDPEMLQRTRQTIADHEVQLLVGRPREELDAALWPLAAGCLAGALILPLLAALVLLRLVPRALQPLQALSEAVAERGADHLHPFPAAGVREVDPIIERLNLLMGRIGEARRRERQFLVDAAHELRTPLAELQALADAALLAPEDAAGNVEALHDMRDVTRHMARLVDALFKLARHGRASGTPEPVALAPLLTAVLGAADFGSRARQLTWQVAVPAGASARADPVLLRALCDNLVGNVIAHAQAGSSAEVDWHGTPVPALEFRNECSRAEAEAVAGERLGHGLTIAQLYAFALGVELLAGRTGPHYVARVCFAPGGGSAKMTDA